MLLELLFTFYGFFEQFEENVRVCVLSGFYSSYVFHIVDSCFLLQRFDHKFVRCIIVPRRLWQQMYINSFLTMFPLIHTNLLAFDLLFVIICDLSQTA